MRARAVESGASHLDGYTAEEKRRLVDQARRFADDSSAPQELVHLKRDSPGHCTQEGLTEEGWTPEQIARMLDESDPELAEGPTVPDDCRGIGSGLVGALI